MEELTPRENLVLQYMAAGKTNTEIANELFVSTHTIKAHISAIIRKFGVSNRIKAAVLAVAAGLIDEKKLLKTLKNKKSQ